MENRTNVLGGGGYDVAKNNNLTIPNEQDNCKNKQDNCCFLQNNENIKLNKKKQSVDEAVRRRNSRTKENNDDGTTSTKQVKYVKQAKSEVVHRRTFVLSLLTLMLSVLVLALSFTYSQLSASITATGNIAFTLESPAITYETPLNFKYENGIMTYGLTTNGGTDLSSVPYNITIDNDNILSSYYALVGFQFIDTSTNAEITSGITFGASPSFGSVAMSALTYDATYNSFVSKTSTAVAKGSKLNLMSYFGIMNLSNLSATTIKVNILLVLDKSSNFQSVNRTQNTFVANVKTVVRTVTKPSGYSWEVDPTYYTPIYITSNQSNMSNSTYIEASTSGNAPSKHDPFAIVISTGYYFKVVFNLGIKVFYENTGSDITYDDWLCSGTKVSKTITVSNYNYLVEWVLNSSDTTDLFITCMTPYNLSSSDYISFLTVLNAIEVPLSATNGLWTKNSESAYRSIKVSLYGADNSSDLTNMSLLDSAFLTQSTVNFRAVYSSGCVVGDTKVTTGFNGEYKLAKDIVEGDEVLTFNMTTFEWELCKIIGTSTHKTETTYKVSLANGEVLQLTSGHPIYTRRGWSVCDSSQYDHDMVIYPEILQEQDLQIGDKVKCGDEWIEITGISKIEGEVSVYGLTIEGNHNFLANGMLVHNVASGI